MLHVNSAGLECLTGDNESAGLNFHQYPGEEVLPAEGVAINYILAVREGFEPSVRD